jgi:hypothetical protein
MDYKSFLNSLKSEQCPVEDNVYLKALWYDANNDWHRAHEIVQSMPDAMAARIHAYLHRKEGDDWNSRYWHGRAGSEFPADMSLQQEWEMLVRQTIARFAD